MNLLFTVHMIFALVLAGIAWNTLPRGWQLLQIGWLALRTHADKSDRETNIERQRTVQDGTRFFIGGLGKCVSGSLAAIAALVLVVTAFGYV